MFWWKRPYTLKRGEQTGMESDRRAFAAVAAARIAVDNG